MRARIVSLLLLCVSSCSDDESAAAPLPEAVGLLEIPVARRTSDRVADAAHIAISTKEIRLENTPVIALERARVAATERAGRVITKLKTALTTQPARSIAALRMHAAVPYETMALVLATLESAGVRRVAFETRTSSSQPTTGHIALPSFRVVDEQADPFEFGGSMQRRWDEFVQGWEETSRQCGRSNFIFCAPVPTTPATGGKVQILLTTKGAAANVDFKQFGAEPAAAAPAPAPMLEGVPSAEALPPEPPVTEASFSWRAPAMTDDLSPITGAFRPLCGAQPCGIVHAGAVATMSGRVISFLAAAFSDGSPAPEVVFVFPAR